MFDFTGLLKARSYRPGVDRGVRWGQYKYDGIRLLVSRDMEGRFTAWTRNGLTDHWPVVSRLYGDVLRETMERGTAADCELRNADITAQSTDVSNLIAQEKFNDLELTCFALPWYNGADYRNVDLGVVEFSVTKQLGLPWAETFDFGSHYALSAEGIEHLLAEYSDPLKLEGLIMKSHHYEGWFKLKRTHTLDCVVYDYVISDSDSHSGGLKAIKICISGPDGAVDMGNVGSGFEKVYRLTVKPKELIGKVAEIACDGLAAGGKLRFPRFVRWRDDKTVDECGVDQLDALKRSE